MKIIPFNDSFIIDEFVITQEIIDRGYYCMSKIPEIESVKFLIGGETNMIWPQYVIIEVDEDLIELFPECELNGYVLTWMATGSSSSSSECYIPDPIWGLEGTLYDVMDRNIGNYAQIRYVSQS